MVICVRDSERIGCRHRRREAGRTIVCFRQPIGRQSQMVTNLYFMARTPELLILR